MALVRCSECGRRSSDTYEECRYCGAFIEEVQGKSNVHSVLQGCGLLFLGLVCIGSFAAIYFGKVNTQPKRKVKAKTTSIIPASKAKTITQFKQVIKNILGEAYRDKGVEVYDNTLIVGWVAQESWTLGCAIDVIKSDIRDTMQAAAECPMKFSKLTCLVMMPIVDKYGKTTTCNVITVMYSRAILNRIVWSHFFADGVFKVGEQGTVYLHPIIKRELCD